MILRADQYRCRTTGKLNPEHRSVLIESALKESAVIAHKFAQVANNRCALDHWRGWLACVGAFGVSSLDHGVTPIHFKVTMVKRTWVRGINSHAPGTPWNYGV